ncbi:hypothetical protein, partial [Aeromonas caviae]|uniref:hypothetical protein n=1 Tax=Aeromonas caviae TaxID=648 RepID=UPI0038D0F131
SSMSDKWAKKSITGGSNKMRTPDQIAEKSESSIKSQGMIPPCIESGLVTNLRQMYLHIKQQGKIKVPIQQL